jgi:DNA-directed RNA polymerase subunit RPC12/RpoP
MPRWNDKNANGKGSEPRNVGKKFKANYDDINWCKPNKPKIEKTVIGYKCIKCLENVYIPKKYGNVSCKCGSVFIDNIGCDTVRFCLDFSNVSELYEYV